MSNSKLFDGLRLGDLELANRIVMAPLTRSRATPIGDAPHDLNVAYYRQRATAGLIITEATHITPEAKGYALTPGIYSDAQIQGWRQVTDAVHAEKGRIFVQLWHVGRVSHSSLQPDEQPPVAPSAITADAMVFNDQGPVATSAPRALETSEMARIVEDYRQAALNAKAAGFDGIELHAGNGYLLDQFLRDGSNQRDDTYGGSIENRARLLFEVLEALLTVWPAGRIGIRLSPFSHINGIHDSDPMAVFSHVIKELNALDLGYLHMIEGETLGPRELAQGVSITDLRALFNGTYMANNGYDLAMANRSLETGQSDLVAFGRLFIANPDLPARLAQNAELAAPDPDTFYGGDAKGYTDYPALAAHQPA